MRRTLFRCERFRLCLPLLAAAALAASCGTEADEVYDWTGTWDGTATISAPATQLGPAATQTGVAQLVLTQSGGQVSGTWKGDSPAGQFEGSVAGRVTDTTITMTISTLNPFPCALSGQGTRSGETMAGQLSTQACALPLSGSFSFTKK